MDNLSLIRYSARSLVRQPGFTLAAALTLALAIGANTAIFSVVDAVLLTPPPFRNAGELAVIWGKNPEVAKLFGIEELPLSTANLYDWRRESRSFDSLALIQSDRMTLSGDGDPEQLGVVRTAGDLFRVLATPPLVGRALTEEDDAPGVPTTAVLSYNFWQRRFQGDPGVVGRKVVLNGNPIVVVGVMPPRFAFPRGSEMPAGYGFSVDPDAWVPMALSLEQREDRGSRFSIVVGRLKPGVSAAAAEAELAGIGKRLGEAHPNTDGGWSARLVPIVEQMVGSLRPVLLVLWAAVGLVLLIACVNVANLLLARAASRQKEIALRTAIGAGRGQLVAQLLAESALLSLLGGAFGLALAGFVLRLCALYVPAGLAGAASFALDGRALLFTLLLCVVATLLAGLVPALQMSRPNLAGALREGTRAGSGTAESRRTRNALVIAEVAIAVVVLVGAGLLLRSFNRLMSIDPGFKTEGVLTFKVDLPPDRYTPQDRIGFFNRLTEKLESFGGVSAAAAVSELPMGGYDTVAPILIEGRPVPKPNEMALVGARTVTHNYFDAMQIRLIKGRVLQAGDTRMAPEVAVIDEALAEAWWPGEEALGKRFRRAPMGPDGGEAPSWITVVGVVGNVRHGGLYTPARPTMYSTPEQTPPPMMPYQMVVVVRTAGDPGPLVGTARNAIYEVDRNQPISQVRPLRQVVDESISKNRVSLLLLAILAILCLVLAVVGIYGITAYSVARRTRELGLRVALGARPAEVLGLVVKETGVLAAAGIVLGVALAYVLTRLAEAQISSLLYEVQSSDPVTFTGVALGLGLVALSAAWLPGRRATRVSPMEALRAE
ncbi:MAG TPA: ABC transporter permease [Acidobacteria bacterium]|nr:ABC transporter permease [Acidobacteriota bacterium]